MVNKEIEQLNQYKECLNSLPNGVAIIDESQEVIFTNKALLDIVENKNKNIQKNLLQLKNARYYQKGSNKLKQKIEENFQKENNKRVKLIN